MSSTYSTLRRITGLLLWFGFAVCLFAPGAIAQSGAPSRSEASSESADSGQQIGYLLADKVYTKPDAFSEEVQSITRDDQVRVVPVPDKEGWYEVYKMGSTGRVGFAFRPYVSRFGSAGLASYKPGEEVRSDGAYSSATQPLFEVAFAPLPDAVGARRLVKEWANVRVGPGMEHEAFGVIRPDVPFQVVAVERGWGKIKLEDAHDVGYVSAALLHSVPDPVAAAQEETTDEADEEPVRAAVIGSGVAGGGAAGEAESAETSQADALREVLSGSGVDAEATVYVTRTGRKFHREGCKHLRSRTFAIPLAEAMLDYSPCRTCRPLQPTDD